MRQRNVSGGPLTLPTLQPPVEAGFGEVIDLPDELGVLAGFESVDSPVELPVDPPQDPPPAPVDTASKTAAKKTAKATTGTVEEA